MKQKMGAIFIATVAAGFLASCGGGGSGTDVVTPPPVVTPDPALPPIVLNLEDPFTFVLGGTDGLWNFEGGGGGGGGDGGGDGGGGGGDGEFIKVKMKFPTLTIPTGSLTWTVLRSQFGIDKNTGVLTIVKDTSGQGGYKVTEVNGSAAAVRPTQANFFVSASGQLSGSFPLPIGAGGAVKDSIFSGIRFNDAKSSASDLSEYAGTYLWASIGAPVGGGATSVGSGVFRINADGTGRVCPSAYTWSATCRGLDISAKFDDLTNRNLVRIVQAKVQSLAIPASDYTTVDLLAVFRKFGTSGVAVTADVVGAPSSGVKETSALYGSRMPSAPLDPASLIGAYNLTQRNAGASSGPAENFRAAIANVGGAIKANSGNGSNGCDPATSSTLVAGTVNGAITGIAPSGPNFYFVPLDVDYGVVFTPDADISFARRFSKDPTKAPCQPG